MKYLLQFGIIMAISFAGELLHDFLPLPVPASIYGILILFSLLRFKILHVAQIKETAMFLISIMAFLFLPAAVGLVVAWPVMKSAILQYIAANVLSSSPAWQERDLPRSSSCPVYKKENPKEASHDFSS